MIARFFPAAGWLARYSRADLAGDAVAGLVVAIMVVPQGMAYATLAGLPPEIGLYASVVPLVAYALFGTSRALAVGPVAVVSLDRYVTPKPFLEVVVGRRLPRKKP